MTINLCCRILAWFKSLKMNTINRQNEYCIVLYILYSPYLNELKVSGQLIKIKTNNKPNKSI
jgi:hypothetical protein